MRDCEGGTHPRFFGIEAEVFSGSTERMSSEASNELQRLLRMLTETATKAESEAYTAGWRDCRAAMMKALSGVADEPQAAAPAYTPVSELNGTNGSSYTN
jgi:hypothetical protein